MNAPHNELTIRTRRSNPPLEHATFLFTDIVGSTRLWDRNPESMSQAIDRHDAILLRAFERHLGFVIATRGDGFCAAFCDPTQAIWAAVEGEVELACQRWCTATPLAVRMAIHTAWAERKDGTYVGPPLNRAARILGLARGGEILVSHTTRDLAAISLDGQVRFVDLGERALRGLSSPERIYRLAA